MPKRPRQSHIPSQVRRRKPRRTPDFSNSLPAASEAPGVAEPVAVAAAAQQSVRLGGRRLAAASGAREGSVHRTVAGQLPTFDRAYLVRELTQIAVVSGLLLGVIIALWLVMR